MKTHFDAAASRDPERQARELLRGLAMHLSYDAGLNGSSFTEKPFGRVSMDETQSFWLLGAAALPKDAPGPLASLVRDVTAHFRGGAEGTLSTLHLDAGSGSLWQRIQAPFERAPDVITDVVAPLIRKSLHI